MESRPHGTLFETGFPGYGGLPRVALTCACISMPDQTECHEFLRSRQPLILKNASLKGYVLVFCHIAMPRQPQKFCSAGRGGIAPFRLAGLAEQNISCSAALIYYAKNNSLNIVELFKWYTNYFYSIAFAKLIFYRISALNILNIPINVEKVMRSIQFNNSINFRKKKIKSQFSF